MNYLTVRKWDEWQSYRKDRQQPPWIKLHRELLRNPEWISLSDTQRGQLVSIWMLAADKNGRVPDDANLIQRMCYMQKAPDLNLLIERGFLDARVTPRRRQADVTVTPQRRVEESRVEESAAAAASPKKGSQVPEGWEPSLETLERLRTKKGFPPGIITSELERFRDYHRSKGSVFKDFEAAFRNWMSNAREFATARNGQARPMNGIGVKAPLQFKPEAKEIVKPPPEDRERQLQRLLKARAM
jgi:hypothetical protein